MVISEFFRALIFDWRKKRAVRQAQLSADLYRKKFLVLVHDGRPVCVSMQGVKKIDQAEKAPWTHCRKSPRNCNFEVSPRNTSRPCS